MNEIVLLWATFADAAEAERVAEAVLAERLAACVNIFAPCTSIYRWQGKTERNSEVPALFKTSGIRARRLRDRIAELHSYDLPVIETWSAQAGAAVCDWVTGETIA